MKARMGLCLLALLPGMATAQDSGGTRIKGDELSALVTGAKVTHVSRNGSTRTWTNEPDGTLYANSDNRKYGGAAGTRAAGHSGKWSLSGDGKYCVQIDWKREAEDWCAAIVKADDGAYYLNSVDPAKKIEFAR